MRGSNQRVIEKLPAYELTPSAIVLYANARKMRSFTLCVSARVRKHLDCSLPDKELRPFRPTYAFSVGRIQ